MRNMPTKKHVSESLRMPMPTPDTVDMVATAVMHQMMITYQTETFSFHHQIEMVALKKLATLSLPAHWCHRLEYPGR